MSIVRAPTKFPYACSQIRNSLGISVPVRRQRVNCFRRMLITRRDDGYFGRKPDFRLRGQNSHARKDEVVAHQNRGERKDTELPGMVTQILNLTTSPHEIKNDSQQYVGNGIRNERSLRPNCHATRHRERGMRCSGSGKDTPQQIDQEKSGPRNSQHSRQ